MKSHVQHVALVAAFGVIGQARAQQTVVPLVRSAGANASRIDVEGQAAIQGSTLDAIFGTPA